MPTNHLKIDTTTKTIEFYHVNVDDKQTKVQYGMVFKQKDIPDMLMPYICVPQSTTCELFVDVQLPE